MLLIVVLVMDQLAIRRDRHPVDGNNFPIALVGLLDGAVPNPLKRNHRVAGVSRDGILWMGYSLPSNFAS